MHLIHPRNAIFEFGGFRFDPLGGLECGGRAIHLAPLEHRALEVLLSAGGRVVDKEVFAQAAWNGGTPSDYSIARCVHLLRRALARPDAPDVIETFHGRGYRIAVPVRQAPVAPAGESASNVRTGAPASVDAMQEARELAGRRTPEELAAAIRILAEVHGSDPGYAPALALTADLRTYQALRRHLRPLEVAPQILADATEALALDPANSWAYAARGWARSLLGWDHSRGLADLDRAIEIDPRYVRGRHLRWWVQCALGREDEALADANAAARACPLSPWVAGPVAWSNLATGRTGKALDAVHTAAERFPTVDIVQFFSAIAAACAGEHDEAIAAGERAVNLSRGSPMVMTVLAHAYANAGRRDEARMVLRWMQETPLGAPPSLLVPVHVALGEPDAALAALARAGEERCPWLALTYTDPRNEPLRTRPEFARLATVQRAPPAAVAAA